jgi:THO complex subunit 7
VKKLTKKYVAYVNALAQDDGDGDGTEAERAREAWLKEIALYEFNMGRYRAVASANAREMEQYASASAAVDGEVRGTKDEIAALKADLDGARLDRQHKEEYEALRRLCVQFPSRSNTTARLASLEAEIAELETESEATASKLDLRKKQFALLLHLVNELQGELAEEAATEAAEADAKAAEELEEGEMEEGEMEEGEMEEDEEEGALDPMEE